MSENSKPSKNVTVALAAGFTNSIEGQQPTEWKLELQRIPCGKLYAIIHYGGELTVAHVREKAEHGPAKWQEQPPACNGANGQCTGATCPCYAYVQRQIAAGNPKYV